MKGVTYQGYPIYGNPNTGEFAWEDRDHLIELPENVERAIRDGVKGHLR
jgi:hypothetical protein